jgi:hemoglobin
VIPDFAAPVASQTRMKFANDAATSKPHQPPFRKHTMKPVLVTCTEDEVRHLVHTFYANVRRDPVLAPIFDAHIKDWDHHLGKMVDFWSAILRGTARYHGTPMPKHAVLPDLDAGLFQRWLALFRATTASLANPAMSSRADEMAQRIAQSLWFGYQLHRKPEESPSSLVTTA